MKKKYLYIIIGVIFAITLGLFIAAFVLMYGGNNGGNGTGSNNPLLNLFPFGQPANPGGTTGTGTGTGNTGTPGTIPAQPITNILRQISKTPTAGFLPTLRGNEIFVEYAEGETGNVFETKLSDMSRVRLSNALIPGVQEAFFGDNGKTAVLRYLEEGSDAIISYALNVSIPIKPNNTVIIDASSTPDNKPNGTFLIKDIASAIVSPDTSNMFFISSTADFATRKTVGVLYDFKKGTYSTIFRSQFSEWLPIAYNGNIVILQTKASQNVGGYLYSLNLKDGRFNRILSETKGLTALPSPDGKYILYSENTGGGFKTYIHDTTNNSSISIEPPTLAEKCVWKKDSSIVYCAAPQTIPFGQYPDSWYMSTISFNDSVWGIIPKTGGTYSLFTTTRANQSMDIINPTLSLDEQYFVFINKKDSTLWMYDLSGIEEGEEEEYDET